LWALELDIIKAHFVAMMIYGSIFFFFFYSFKKIVNFQIE
jgi:hypothetical protein